MATENKDWGYLWEGEAEGVSSLENIWFRYADNLDAVDAAAFGIDSEGNVSRDTTVISAGNLLYDPLTKYFSCKCPFEKVERWKLYIWRRNEDLSLRELEWSNGQKIPVSGLVSDVNTLKQRVKDHTTNIGRSLKVPEIGTSSLLFPPKEVRAGQVAGFDDDGNPATGENVAQVKELYDVQRNCEDYVDKAAAYAKDSEQSAERSWQYAEDSRESAYNAADSEDDALAHAKEAQGWYEKTGEAAETGIANIEQAAAKAEADFDGKIKDAVSTAEEAKDSAKEDADRAEDVYAKLIELKENYEKLECFICCAAKHVEKNRKFVEDLLAENAEGLNALSPATTTHQGIVYLAESADDKRESTVLSAAMSAEILSDVVADVSADLADLRAKLTSAMHYKGAVATKAELPTTGNEPGDVWNVIEDGKNYAWDGTAWDDISGVMSIPQATTTTLGGVKLYSSTVGSTTGSAAVLLTATGCMVVPQATTTTAGVGKIGTAIVPADDGGMVGLTNNGSFAVGIANTTNRGCVKLATGISDTGTSSVLTAAQVKTAVDAKLDKDVVLEKGVRRQSIWYATTTNYEGGAEIGVNSEGEFGFGIGVSEVLQRGGICFDGDAHLYFYDACSRYALTDMVEKIDTAADKTTTFASVAEIGSDGVRTIGVDIGDTKYGIGVMSNGEVSFGALTDGNYCVAGIRVNQDGQTILTYGQGMTQGSATVEDIVNNISTSTLCFEHIFNSIGNLKFKVLTQAEYDALTTKDANTLYFING